MWITSALSGLTSTDHEFSKAFTAPEGKKITAGGYWMSGLDINTQVTVRVNGPSIDENGVAGQWVVAGYVPSPSSSWGVVVYVDVVDA
jgi:hypothetical protein